ncbi:MAG: amidophosphoribosyltransferase, partial [Cyclonatronaceae bacterium]
SCKYEDIAVALAAPIVEKEPSRNEVVVHGGGIHLSKDQLDIEGVGKLYGRVAELSETRWNPPLPLPENYVRKLSQEHGIIRLSQEAFRRVEVGGLLAILPVHSCLSADCMGGYLTETGAYISMMNWRQ